MSSNPPPDSGRSPFARPPRRRRRRVLQARERAQPDRRPRHPRGDVHRGVPGLRAQAHQPAGSRLRRRHRVRDGRCSRSSPSPTPSASGATCGWRSSSSGSGAAPSGSWSPSGRSPSSASSRILAWYGYEHFLRAWNIGDSTIDIEIPLWPSKLLVPVAFAVLLVRLFIQVLGFLRLSRSPGRRTGRDPPHRDGGRAGPARDRDRTRRRVGRAGPEPVTVKRAPARTADGRAHHRPHRHRRAAGRGVPRGTGVRGGGPRRPRRHGMAHRLEGGGRHRRHGAALEVDQLRAERPPDVHPHRVRRLPRGAHPRAVQRGAGLGGVGAGRPRGRERVRDGRLRGGVRREHRDRGGVQPGRDPAHARERVQPAARGRGGRRGGGPSPPSSRRARSSSSTRSSSRNRSAP